jgi:DNA-binding XRE family transcriptional regulator
MRPMKRTSHIRLIEKAHGKRLEALIREGIEAGDTWSELADRIGCSRQSIINWAKEMGVEIITTRTVRIPSEEQMGEAVS